MVNSYWKERIDAEITAKMERGATLADEMARLHTYHFNELEKEIRAFSDRYADKENVPLSEVKARVDAMDVKAFEEKAKRYVEEKDFSQKANSELAIYNLKMKTNRLELLQYQMDLEMLALGNAEHKLTERFLNAEFISALNTQAGLLGQSVLSSVEVGRMAEAIQNTSFQGAKWSDRIWERQQALREIVANGMEDYLLKGKNPTGLIPQLRREFDVSAREAKRLAVTEGARVATEAQRLTYEANGYDEYEYIAEPSACPMCAAMDGEIYKVREMMPGGNAAPMHPHCHCSTAPHFELSSDEIDSRMEEILDEEMRAKEDLETKLAKTIWPQDSRQILDNTVGSGIIRVKDIQVPQSLSAMARDIYVKSGYPVRGDYKIQPGSKITNVEVIAGKDVRRQIDDIYRLVKEHGGNAKDWQKVKGIATLSDGRKIEAHWYQAKNVGKVEFKIKRWL